MFMLPPQVLTCLLLGEGGGGRGQEATPSHVPHTHGFPCGVAESTLKLWYFKGMPTPLKLEWELTREEV